MNTYPEMNAKIVGILRTGNEPSQYAAQRIEELEAIVAKLPKTADGVPIVPGMELHCIGDAEQITCVVVTGIFLPAECSMFQARESGRTVLWSYRDAYSTHEAAEAAREA